MQADADEARLELAGHGSGQEGLAAAGRAPEQEATTQLRAVGPAQLGVAQRGEEALVQSLLDVLEAAHVGQGHPGQVARLDQHLLEEAVPVVFLGGPVGHGPVGYGVVGADRSRQLLRRHRVGQRLGRGTALGERAVQPGPPVGPGVPQRGRDPGGQPEGLDVIGLALQHRLEPGQGVGRSVGVQQETGQVHLEGGVPRVGGGRFLNGAQEVGVGCHAATIVLSGPLSPETPTVVDAPAAFAASKARRDPDLSRSAHTLSAHRCRAPSLDAPPRRPAPGALSSPVHATTGRDDQAGAKAQGTAAPLASARISSASSARNQPSSTSSSSRRLKRST